MVDLSTRLQPNEEEVAAKVLDGEAIMINLATGSYYSMADAGALVWESIAQHCSVEEIAARLAGDYDVAIDRARNDVLAVASQLLEHGVVKLSDATAAHGDAAPRRPSRLPYAPPTLSAFNDMRNLLALDPPMPTVDALKQNGSKGTPPNTTDS